MLLLKPHHFMDILKLYGSGIEQFVPDERFGHDFYRAANEIVANHRTAVTLTVDGDDICRPCSCLGADGRCTDSVTIAEYTSKDGYNKVLDHRVLELCDLTMDTEYMAKDLCRILYEHREMVFQIWKEEPDEITQKRYRLFCAGCEKYLHG